MQTPSSTPGLARQVAGSNVAVEQLAWILGAAALGFGIAETFSSVLHLPRDVYLVPYVAGAGAYLEAYRRRHHVDVLHALRSRWVAGVLGACVAGAFVVFSVLRQPASPRPTSLALHVSWLGLMYGAVDGLLLSVLPVAATWRALAAMRRGESLADGLLALAASLLVCAAYHLGYAEYRGAGLAGPLIGVGVMTVAYIATRNPLAPLLSHLAMHVAAVLHGIDSTVQLPPHS